MHYSPKFFKDTIPEWKRKKDPIIARYIHRPLSFFFSSVFTEMGLTPNQVSFISLLIAIIACVLFAIPNTFFLLFAYCLLNLWSITDSADGNMARSLGGKPYGDFIDATSSYFMYGMMFLPLAYSAAKMGNIVLPISGTLLVVIGALTGSFDTMTRLFFQKMKNNAYEIRLEQLKERKNEDKDITDRSQGKIERLQARLDSEFTCGGTVHLIMLLVCILVKAVDVYVVLYFIYNGVTFLASIVYLIKKTGCLKR